VFVAEIAMTRFLIAAMALLLVHCGTACAADQDCMPVYYRTKAPDCVDEVLSQLAQAGAKSEPSTSIGFLAQLFVASPGEKQRILDGETSDRVRAVQLVALFRAGLRDDARLFAEKSRLSAMLAKLEAAPPPPLSAVEPSSTPGDNDLLIGAYMASGDAALIQRIMDNFSGAEDGMAYEQQVRPHPHAAGTRGKCDGPGGLREISMQDRSRQIPSRADLVERFLGIAVAGPK
jgi:hypothetical protein